MTVDLIVIGSPAPQGSKVAFKHRTTGKAVMRESSSVRQRSWRTAVSEVAHATYLGDKLDPIADPCYLQITFRMPCPKSRAKQAPLWHAVSPDLSKLVRATEDALVDGGILHDDRYIAKLEVYALEVVGWTGATIRVGLLARYEGTGTAAVREGILT